MNDLADAIRKLDVAASPGLMTDSRGAEERTAAFWRWVGGYLEERGTQDIPLLEYAEAAWNAGWASANGADARNLVGLLLGPLADVVAALEYLHQISTAIKATKATATWEKSLAERRAHSALARIRPVVEAEASAGGRG